MSPACWLGERRDRRATWDNWDEIAICPSVICDRDTEAINNWKNMQGKPAFGHIERHNSSASFRVDWTRSASFPRSYMWRSI